MKSINAEIITIGDEILYGQILDTNTHWLSIELDRIGVRIVRKTTIGDQEGQILQVFSEAESRADIILITGGLGPTNDDLTKPTLSKYFNSPLKINDQALKELTELFQERGKELTALNRKQAELPECCKMIPNKNGTAAGMWFEKDGKIFVSMPGVPHEMKAMMESSILPALKKQFQTPVIFHKMIKTVGIGESWLSDLIKNWENNLPANIKLAYLPSIGHVKLRLTASGNSLELLKQEVDEQIKLLLPFAEKYIYGYDNTTLEEAVGQLLKNTNQTIATAESCTGGAIAKQITSVPGSSAYFRGGIIPYHNDIKEEILGVEKSTLISFGAVSEETVKEMAINVRKLLNASIGIASSGIAGPSGGTKEKPVGTVWVAYSSEGTTFAKKLMLGNDRTVNIEQTIIAVLNLVRLQLSNVVI
ncbi:MAG: competence/damage-inducible protein A [Bacteroidota bacterium]|nr:competence/damage-inducible protein A [Bacteroidota bacterium]